MVKKILLSSAVILTLNATEFEYGNGEFEIKGGLVGLNQASTADISTYSIVEQHKNLFKSKWFYKFNFTWYDSKDMVSTQENVNNTSQT